MAKTGNNGRLAEKLRSEYRNRGASLHGVEATPTSELMKRAQMGHDPKVNVSAQAFDDMVHGRRADGAQGGRGTASSRRGAAASQNGAFASRSGAAAAHGRGKATPDQRGRRQSDGKRADAGTAGRAKSGMQSDRTAPFNGAGGNGGKNAGSHAGMNAGGAAKRMRGKETANERNTYGDYRDGRAYFRDVPQEDEPFEEIRVARKRIPAGFLLGLTFVTVMVMLILTSVAQLYQITGEISDKKDTVQTLKDTIDDLELALDQKNDIRLIEQMATAEFGMVKADAVQRKYISLSDGERVDIIADGETDNAEGSTMLSGFLEVFGGFFEYFK